VPLRVPSATTSIVDALERAPSIIVPLVRDVPSDVLKRRPAPRRWSAHEHACHLAVVHTLFFDRLDQMLATPMPVIRSYLPDQAEPDDMLMQMDLDRALERFVADRARLVARLRTLTESDWQRSAIHEEYNEYSVFIMFRHMTLHDFLHGYRIEELLLKKDW
jgi:DinB superfamily